MPRGTYDWNIDTDAIAQDTLEANEMSAKLNAVNTILREGKQVLADTFNLTYLPWYIVASPNNSKANIVTTNQYRGIGCLRITNPDKINSTFIIERFISSAYKLPLGISVMAYLTEKVKYINLEIINRNKINDVRYALRYDNSNNTLYHLKSDGTYEADILNLTSLWGSLPSYLLFKVKVGSTSGNYYQVRLNDTYEYLTTEAPRLETYTNGFGYFARITCEAQDTSQPLLYLNDFIFTLDDN